MILSFIYIFANERRLCIQREWEWSGWLNPDGFSKKNLEKALNFYFFPYFGKDLKPENS